MNSNVRDAGNYFLAVPIASLRQAVTQSIANSTFTAITLDTSDVDTDNGHSVVTNTSRYTPQTAGYAQYSGGVAWSVNTTGGRGTYWAQNGSLLISEAMMATVSALNVGTVARTKQIFSNGSTDYVEMQAYQTSGGALSTVATSSAECAMEVRWVHT
jgi:hypothetical protein